MESEKSAFHREPQNNDRSSVRRNPKTFRDSKVMNLIPQSLKQFPPQGNKNKNSCLFVLESPLDLEGQTLNSKTIVQHHSYWRWCSTWREVRKPGFSIWFCDWLTGFFEESQFLYSSISVKWSFPSEWWRNYRHYVVS